MRGGSSLQMSQLATAAAGRAMSAPSLIEAARYLTAMREYDGPSPTASD